MRDTVEYYEGRIEVAEQIKATINKECEKGSCDRDILLTLKKRCSEIIEEGCKKQEDILEDMEITAREML